MHLKTSLILLFSIFSSIIFGQWTQLNGPEGGYIRSIIYDGQTLFAASGGGVMVSEDMGETWTFRNTGLTSCDTKSLAIAGDYVFVSTDENVFRTQNSGQNWEPAGTDLNGFYTKSMITCNDTLFAGTYLRGIYRSVDTGLTWTPVNNGFPAKYAYYLETDGTHIFAGTYQDGLYRSSDMGNSWISINSGLTELDIMAIHCYDNKVFLSTLSSGVFVSTDTGDTWNPLGTNIPSVKGFSHEGGVLYAASHGSGVYKSTDTGQTWTTINNGLNETNLWSITTAESMIFAGVKSGHIYKRNSGGGGWSISADLDFNACVGSVCSSGSNLLAGTHGSGFFASTNFGDDWTRITSIWTVETRAIISSNQYVFAGTDMLGIFKSTNNGGSFVMSNSGLTSAWIQSFAICQGKLFAGSGEEGIFVSDDAISSWNQVNTGLTDLNILSLASDGLHVFAGTADSGIFITDNLGENWSQINSGLPDDGVTSLIFFNGNLFAGTRSNGLFYSTDLGNNWDQSVNGISPQANIRCLTSSDTMIFIGTGAGEVLFSNNDGAFWMTINQGLSGSPVLSLWIFNDFLYAGINAGGVWQLPLSQITGVNETEEYSNLNVYPNPSKDIIKIESGQITENSFISIYNLKGQILIYQEIDKERNVIDIKALPAGVYLVKLKTVKGILTTRLIKN